MKNIVTALSALAMVGIGHAAQVNLLVNPSFEEDVIPGGANRQEPIGWTTITTDPLLIAGDLGTVWPDGASDGNQYADIGNASTGVVRGISQTFDVPDGGVITAIGMDVNLPQLGIFQTSSSFRIELYDVNDVLLNPASNSFTIEIRPPNQEWRPYGITLPGVLGAGTYTLALVATGTPEVDVLVDNVRVLADVPDLPADPIPVPAAAVLFGPALFLLRRRRG
ncbi:MAG: hypothetical protein AAF608_09540 [Pseudomonadota bacterium]